MTYLGVTGSQSTVTQAVTATAASSKASKPTTKTAATPSKASKPTTKTATGSTTRKSPAPSSPAAGKQHGTVCVIHIQSMSLTQHHVKSISLTHSRCL